MVKKSGAEKQDWAEMLDVEGKASGVTKQNYYRLFQAYAMHHAKHKEDVGVTINPIDHPQQWGAWSAYLKKIKLPMTYFLSVGQRSSISNEEQRELHGYQVPAKFPSDFDADAEWVFDKSAGDVFIERQSKRRAEAAEFAKNKPPLNLSYKNTNNKQEKTNAENT